MFYLGILYHLTRLFELYPQRWAGRGYFVKLTVEHLEVIFMMVKCIVNLVITIGGQE